MKNVRFLLVTFALSLLNVFAAGAQTLPTPTRPLPPLTEWKKEGGTLAIASDGDGLRVGPPSNAEWGNCYIEGDIDTDATPYLAVMITEMGRNAKWLLTVNDQQPHALEGDGQDIGLRVYDLRKAPANFSGRRHCRIYLTVQGSGKSVVFGGMGLFAAAPSPVSAPDIFPVPHWTRMNNSLATILPDGGVNLAINEATTDQWGGIIAKLPVDRGRFPLIEAEVKELTPGAKWRVAVDATASGPDHQSCGTVAFNYADFSPWRGSHDAEIQLVCSRIGGGQILRAGKVQFVAYPSASRTLVSRASRLSPRPLGKPLLTTENFRLYQDKAANLFRIERMGGASSLATRFLEMPDFETMPTGDVKRSHAAKGDSFTYTTLSNGVSFAIVAETFAQKPNLLHWRVTATPKRPTKFPSCGHEVAYVPNSDTPLKRIALQDNSATALAYTIAPGLGTVLYVQNLTALNPVMEKCHISPRWLVSAGNATFGFANPLDTSVTFPTDTPVVLSDAYLTIDPDEPDGKMGQAERFLDGLAAIYDALPDKPNTEWLDWRGMAPLALRDLNSPDCWRPYGDKEFLQPYVGMYGTTILLAGLQDVIGPVSEYANATGTGAETVKRLDKTLPEFWSSEHNTLRTVAMAGNDQWYNLELHIGVARAALAGDKIARDLILKSADAMIRLAHETDYNFPKPADEDYLPKERAPRKYEYPGIFILFMMQCYELSPEKRFLEEARQSARRVRRDWDFNIVRNAGWSGMTAEGLGRLYTVTKDPEYARLGIAVLAPSLREAWLWECNYAAAKNYTTFFGFSAHANNTLGGVDYIAPSDEYINWRGFREYYLRTQELLSPSSRLLLSELLRRAPQCAWYCYPPHLPPDSLRVGKAFWNTDNNYSLYVPVEDLNEGWRKNGSVGQMLYGTGAAFSFATLAYTPVPEAGLLVYSEYPLHKVSWDAKRKSLLLEVGGVSQYASKIEVRPLESSGKAGVFPWAKLDTVKGRCAVRQKSGAVPPATALPLTVAVIGEKSAPVTVLRAIAPGNSFVRFFVEEGKPTAPGEPAPVRPAK